MGRPPKVQQNEMQKLQDQFDRYDENIKQLTQEPMGQAPIAEQEPQTKLSSAQLEKFNDVYLKPRKTIRSLEKFNERFREDYEYKKEYVKFIAENKEIIGESIDIWTKPFPGLPAEEWIVPVNKPVWGPRYLAEQITNCQYRRLKMDQQQYNSADGMGTYYGQLVVDETVKRLDARPVTSKKSLFF